MELMFVLLAVIFGPSIGAIVYLLKPPTWIPTVFFFVAFFLGLGDGTGRILSILAVASYVVATVVTFFFPFVWWFVIIWTITLISVVVCIILIRDNARDTEQENKDKIQQY